MGIPKFFRYVSERWPHISQLINESQVPEFDNLYLDMNSILHNATHKDADVTTRLSDEQMYVAIFNYIEHLFDLIKPKKMFYMAIDGVAPRAKMNQQRARRFRSALDAEKARKKAIEQGVELPKEEPFDSNAITPGTEFMARLTVQLKYFINKKVSEDRNWQNIEIILSGHEVPGEGEHKIMEQIRVMRAQKDYDSNVRHCLYGLDADLIMLGLLSHDPHFALLREEVTFGPRAKRQVELTEQKFYLLHLSLVREYLELEFDDVRDSTGVAWDFERVLDDFILLNFFIGNDFLPELPSLLINDGALPIVLATYKEVLKKSDSYLSKDGVIDFERLGEWLDEISKFEYRKFEELAIDVDFFNEDLQMVSLTAGDEVDESDAATKEPGMAKPFTGKVAVTPRQKELIRMVKPFILAANNVEKTEAQKDPPSMDLPPTLSQEDQLFLRRVGARTSMKIVEGDGRITMMLDVDDLVENEDSDEDDGEERLLRVNRFLRKYEKAEIIKDEELEHKREVYNTKFDRWRNKYYELKFGFSIKEEDKIAEVAENYLEGLQWVLFYYYRGIASWGWYFRYHYAPRITDIKLGLKNRKNFSQFTLGTPFHPFEQLMGVLPDRSKALVPQPYRWLMSDELSPIIDFYPHEFALDMNGKKNDWEAVVKIPFVDEKRLLAAMAPAEAKLTPEERERNKFGANIQFAYNPQIDYVYPSSMPGALLDIEHCHCKEIVLERPSLGANSLRFGLMEEAKLGKSSLAGFPSLKTLQFTHKLEMAGVQVFQQPSRRESRIITVINGYDKESSKGLVEKLVGENIHIGWPYLREAKVVAISDDEFRYEVRHGRVAGVPLDQEAYSTRARQIGQIIGEYKKYGTKIGPVDYLVHVRKLRGLKRLDNGAFVKDFEEGAEQVFAVQTVVENVEEEDERFKERDPLPVEEEFPVDSRAIYLGPKGYGNPVTVKGHTTGDKLDIHLMKLERPEPTIGAKAAQFERQSIRYMPSYEIAKRMKITPLFLSKVTSKYLVKLDDRSYDLGLMLKLESKRQKVLGYSRKGAKTWEFTGAAVELVNQYRAAYPRIFAALQTLSKVSDIPDLKTVFKDVDSPTLRAQVEEARKWIIKNTSQNPQYSLVELETEALAPQTVRKIESVTDTYFSDGHEPVRVMEFHGVPRRALLTPTHAYHQLRMQKFSLGDRVVSALNFGKVQLYSRGTVIAINSHVSKVTLDVMFDQQFEQGTTLGGRLEKKCGLTVDAGSVINLTNRQLIFESKKSLEMRKQHAAAATAQYRPSSVGTVQSAWSKAPPVIAKRANGTKPPPPAAAAAAAAAPRGPTGRSQAPAQAQAQSQVAKQQNKHVVTNVKAPAKSEAQAQPKASVKAQGEASNEQLSKDLLSMLKAAAPPGQAPPAQAPVDPAAQQANNESALKNIKGTGAKAQQFQRLNNAIYSQFGGPGPMPPQGPPVPPVPPQFMSGQVPFGMPPGPMPGPMPFDPSMGPPPPHFMPGPPPPMAGPQYDEQASADLMAQLQISGSGSGSSDGPQQDSSANENDHASSRGNGRGRGGRGARGGRGRGRGSSNRGSH